MDKGISTHEYQLSFGEGEKRIEFRAKNFVQALVRAEDLIPPGRSATLIEDGLPMCTISEQGFTMFPAHCRPATGF
jgi:hypothetical protein